MKPAKNFVSYNEERHDVFLSFSTKDREFVKKLYDILRDIHNIEPWYSGVKFYDNIPDFLIYDINNAIKNSNYCIAIFTENVIDNKWFFAEIGGFFHKETLKKRRIIPVLHDMTLDDFIEEFPIFADRFVICNYTSVEEAAKQVAKFISIEQETENNIVEQPNLYLKTIFSLTKFVIGGKEDANNPTIQLIDTQSIRKDGIDRMESFASEIEYWNQSAQQKEQALLQKFVQFLQRFLG